jgi:arylsulfatase A-like enzyme
LALYDAEITELDEKIAPLLALASDNTLVVVTADHGESFSHDYYFNHRVGLWDEVTHVPLLIGGGTQGAKRVSQQVGLIDILPTVLDLSGLPSDRRFMGTSRVDWFDNTTPSTEMVYSITDPWMPEPQFAVRTETSKWIDGLKQTLVYDLRSDPLEAQSSTTIPKSLQSAKEQYQEMIANYQQWLAESPRKRQISDEECKRLMALGYTTCMPQ